MFGFLKKPKSQATTDNKVTTSSRVAEKGLLQQLKQGLSKTRDKIKSGFANLFSGSKSISPELLKKLEELLLSADVGLSVTKQIVTALEQQCKKNELRDAAALQEALRNYLVEFLKPYEIAEEYVSPEKPYVFLIVGVNGAGKTTTLAKLAHRLKDKQSVMLAAGDTFRAGAIEQLQEWGQSVGIPVVAQKSGADSGAVIFDAYSSAKAKEVDVLLADTAGRLHTQDNLMRELEKIVRVIRKKSEQAPHEIMLVLDASIGQNSLMQAKLFHEKLKLTSIAITKLDGTAKGGAVFAIADTLKLPIRYIGIGEKTSDLKQFKADEFVEALLG